MFYLDKIKKFFKKEDIKKIRIVLRGWREKDGEKIEIFLNVDFKRKFIELDGEPENFLGLLDTLEEDVENCIFKRELQKKIINEYWKGKSKKILIKKYGEIAGDIIEKIRFD